MYLWFARLRITPVESMDEVRITVGPFPIGYGQWGAVQVLRMFFLFLVFVLLFSLCFLVRGRVVSFFLWSYLGMKNTKNTNNHEETQKTYGGLFMLLFSFYAFVFFVFSFRAFQFFKVFFTDYIYIYLVYIHMFSFIYLFIFPLIYI